METFALQRETFDIKYIYSEITKVSPTLYFPVKEKKKGQINCKVF